MLACQSSKAEGTSFTRYMLQTLWLWETLICAREVYMHSQKMIRLVKVCSNLNWVDTRFMVHGEMNNIKSPLKPIF